MLDGRALLCVGGDGVLQICWLFYSFFWELIGDELIYLGPGSLFEPGDVNLDSSINVLDIVLLVQFILDFQAPNNEQEILADVNDDSDLSILDVVVLVNMILP